jgi:hypothetical protein
MRGSSADFAGSHNGAVKKWFLTATRSHMIRFPKATEKKHFSPDFVIQFAALFKNMFLSLFAVSETSNCHQIGQIRQNFS